MEAEVVVAVAGRLLVNTTTLGSYGTRLGTVIGRIDTLQSRLRTLYRTGEVSGLYYFYQYNRFYSGMQTLGRCKRYINETVSDMEIVERYFSEVDPLNFVAPQGTLIYPMSARDSRSGWKKNVRNFFTYLTDKAGALLYDGIQLRDLFAILDVGDGAAINDAIQKVLLEATGAESSGSTRSFADDTDLFEDILRDISAASKTMGKITSDADLASFASLMSFSKDIYALWTGSGKPSDTYLDTLTALKGAMKVENSFFKIIDKQGKASFSLGEKMAGVSVFADALGLSIDTVKTYDLFQQYRRGEASGADVIASIIDTGGSGVDFGSSTYSFLNYKKPGSKLFDKKLSQDVYAIKGLLGIFSGGVKGYGEVSADGSVTLEDSAEIMMDAAFGGIQELTFGLISDEQAECASDAVLGFAADWGKDTADYIAERENLQACMENGNWFMRTSVFFGSSVLELFGVDI